MVFQKSLVVETKGRGIVPITHLIQETVSTAATKTGICQLFLHHTSASLIFCENADPTVRDDLERFISRLVPDGDPIFSHTDEGPDDMPAHVRTILTRSDLSFPVIDGHPDLGTWQGIYLWEHRRIPHRRQLTLTIIGQ